MDTKKMLAEFEKHYTGDVRDNMGIYARISEEFDIDLDIVIDTILINRYADEDDFAVSEVEPCDIDDNESEW